MEEFVDKYKDLTTALPKARDWQAPWLNQSWNDGNPLFSVYCPAQNRAVRLLIADVGDNLDTWFEKFGENNEIELHTILVSDSEKSIDKALGRIYAFVEGITCRECGHLEFYHKDFADCDSCFFDNYNCNCGNHVGR